MNKRRLLWAKRERKREVHQLSNPTRKMRKELFIE